MYQRRQRSPIEILTELREDDPRLEKTVGTWTFKTGQVVAEPPVLRRNFFALVKGRIQLVSPVGPDGRRVALATLNPGAVFGDGTYRTSMDPAVTAMALTDCIVWVVQALQAQELLLRYPVLNLCLLQTITERLSQVEDRMEECAYKRVPQRLAALLLELGDDRRLIQGLSHQALANMLGTYRETVSATLRTFRERGLVELGYRRIALRDLARLRTATGSLD